MGQKVRVSVGTLDPDYGDPIGGWSGIVEDIFLSEDDPVAWFYSILWDRNTLANMDRQFHKKCENDNLDVERMVLAEYELEA